MACSFSRTAHHLMFHQSSAAPGEMSTMTPPPPPPEPELSEADFDWMHKVRHRRTGGVFALKEAFFPNPGLEEEAEVLRRAARFPSSYVVRCQAVFLQPEGNLASLLEFMDTGSLFAVLCRRWYRGFPEPVLAEVVARCLMGLAQLHSCGVAHLDVKPENFLTNTSGDVKINDLNTSRIVFGRAGEFVLVPTTMGTKAYFSPEWFEPDAHADPWAAMAADVWVLGLTILELFLGRLPIVPEEEMPKAEDRKKAICNREPPSVTEDMEASPDLREFVALCLQKDPTQRAMVPQLLKHPFVVRRDVAASSRALKNVFGCRLL